MTGSSGGGINAILAARALHYRFPHAPMHSAAAVSERSPNPFYDIWVNDIDITDLLDNSDLQPGMEITSILNGTALDKIACSALKYPSADRAHASVVASAGRSWVYNPLSIVVTHTNLTGIPYAQPFSGLGLSEEYFTNHADYVQLYAGFSPSPESPSPNVKYLPHSPYLNVPAGFDLAPAPVPSNLKPLQWPDIAQNALGTSAYVFGFPARTVKREGIHYAYRFVMDNESGKYNWITPLWSGMASSSDELTNYSFTALDGGFTNNEPILFASQAVEGLQIDSPKESSYAQCAIILIDPLCHPPHRPQESTRLTLAKLLAPTIHMFSGAGRFGTADMAGFLRSDTYNRFLIAPKRKSDSGITLAGGAALCSDGLGAFLGFMCRDFREHDFMLGRRNCQAFLTGTLVLSRENKVFSGHHPEISDGYGGPRPPDGMNECPLIPLYGSATQEQPQPPWPAGKFEPESIRDAIRRRVHLMLKRTNNYLGLPPLAQAVFTLVAAAILAPKISSKAILTIRTELGRKKLL
ncbi:hypothetical protein [Paraburkholderia sp. 2C]